MPEQILALLPSRHEASSPLRWGFDVDAHAADHFGEVDFLAEVTVKPEWDLTATQHVLDPLHPAFVRYSADLAASRDRPGERVTLVLCDGVTYISDGHHRLAAARQHGVGLSADLYAVAVQF